MIFYGEITPEGVIERDVRVCAVTGVTIEAGDALVVVPGTSKFVRVKAAFAGRIPADVWSAIVDGAGPAKQSKKEAKV